MEGARRMSASMTLHDCARKLGARLIAADPATRFHGVSTDSRSIVRDELFVALKGPIFDGHAYVDQVRVRGAVAALVAQPVEVDIAQIVVGDTMWAYGLLAQFWRSRFNVPVISLTGSNGKTTVKEMLRSILVVHFGSEEAVLATEGNLNNNIGLPQMLLQLDDAHRVAVLEMGMNHLYEIDYLTRLAVPDVALIIMAGTAHIGELGSRESIAQAKGEIYAGLRSDGVACINIDDRFAPYWRGLAGDARRALTFGTTTGADVHGILGVGGVTIEAGGESIVASLQVLGEHNQRNAIAAAAGAFALNVPLAAIARGLENFGGVDGRLRTWRGHNSATIVDDTYNANPDSMQAAVAVFAEKSGNRLLVLGDMGELGNDAVRMHADIGAAAAAANIDGLFVLGDMAQHYASAFGPKAFHAKSVDELIAMIKPRLDSNTTVLVKGSRFMKMERVVHALVDPAAGYTLKGMH